MPMNALNSYRRRYRNSQSNLPVPGQLGYITALLMPAAYPGPAHAAGHTGVPASAISTPDILNLISGLFIVIIIFLCIAYLLKRLTGGNITSRGYFKVIDTLHLGTREKIILVRAVDSYLVLGISPGNIKSLHVVTGQLPEEAAETEPDFKSRLRDVLSVARGGHG